MNKKWIINLIVFAVILIAISFGVVCCRRLVDYKKNCEINISALTDSISYYKGKNGQLVAERDLLVIDYDNLQSLYSDLCDDMKNMKIKNADMAVKIKSLINNPDTTICWKYDTIEVSNGIKFFPFNIENKYRQLSGNVELRSNDMQLNIRTDKVFFDYTLAIKDNTVYLTSDNPYVVFDNIKGYKIPQRKKHFGIGINIGFGAQYGLINKNFDIGPQFGISLNYNF